MPTPPAHRSALVLSTITLALLIGLAPTAGLAEEEAAESDIGWMDSPDKALETAKQSGRPIVAYVTSSNCRYCRKMERETWSKPAVARLVRQGWTPLRINASRNPKIVKSLRVRAYPTTVLVASDGKAYASITGFKPAEDMQEVLASNQQPRPVAARPVSH